MNRTWTTLGMILFTFLLQTSLLAEDKFVLKPRSFYYLVDRDGHKFREDQGWKEGFDSGFESLELEKKMGEDLLLTAEGHALVRNRDFDLLFNLGNPNDKDSFSLNTGFKSFNRYYDTTGGYYALFPSLWQPVRAWTFSLEFLR